MAVASITAPRSRIRFEERRAEAVDGMPRMDVAAFVGFAETGPVHVPTRVESFAQFEAIFGGELPLAWDPVRGEDVHALLRTAVRAFFDNGGERCWIVRVAEVVAPNAFPIPGVISLTGGGRPAFAQARAQGRWSDGIKVASVLQAFPLGIASWSRDEAWIELAPTSERELETWDLIRLRFGDASVEAMMFVGALLPGSEGMRVHADDLIWLSSEPPADSPVNTLVGTRAFGAWSSTNLPLVSDVEWKEGEARVPLAMRLEDAPLPGVVLALENGGDPVWLTVAQVSPDPIEDGRIWLSGPIRRRITPPEVPASLPSPTGERLRLELWARMGNGQLVRAGDLGFHTKHHRAWMAIATDEELHGGVALLPSEDPPYGVTAPARRGLAPAEFPLAGREHTRSTTIPIGVLDMPSAFLGADAPPDAQTPLERDGLDVYDERMFVDPSLADARSGTLLADAERIRDLGHEPRRLHGVHALLSIDEITLIAAPDAVHRGWSHVEAAGVRQPVALPPAIEGPPNPTFQRCRGPIPAAPALTAEVDAGVTTIRWGVSGVVGETELQTSIEGDFEDAWVAYAGSAMERTFYGLPPGDLFFRARTTVGGETGPWSDVLPLRVGGGRSWILDGGEVLAWRVTSAVHRALLRMCAARGDTLAILSLPRDTREDDVLRHADELRGFLPARIPSPSTAPVVVPPLTPAERFIASYGALYHPWLFSRAGAGTPPVAIPPAGAVTGAIAGRTRFRGAWIAPANHPLIGVLGREPVSADRQVDLDAGAVNVLLDDPRGVLALSEHTLATEGDFRQIHVRRLLALLKRAALQLGERYVFEPNGPTLRRAVEHACGELLGRMYSQGAFAGASPSQGFRIAAGEEQNPPGAVERGRFVVELRVAPAQPLEFLTVRLVQNREGGLTAEEA